MANLKAKSRGAVLALCDLQALQFSAGLHDWAELGGSLCALLLKFITFGDQKEFVGFDNQHFSAKMFQNIEKKDKDSRDKG